MSKALTDLVEKAALLYDLQYEVIAALGFFVFLLITICVKLYVGNKKKDIEHLSKRFDESYRDMKALDMRVQRQDEKIHDYQTNVIKLESAMRKNSEQIQKLQDENHECRFETDAKLVEVTDKLNDMVRGMTKIIEALNEFTNTK